MAGFGDAFGPRWRPFGVEPQGVSSKAAHRYRGEAVMGYDSRAHRDIAELRREIEGLKARIASGTSGSAQDPQGLDPKGAGPTGEAGDAQGTSP
jgi:hypothetical protein